MKQKVKEIQQLQKEKEKSNNEAMKRNKDIENLHEQITKEKEHNINQLAEMNQTNQCLQDKTIELMQANVNVKRTMETVRDEIFKSLFCFVLDRSTMKYLYTVNLTSYIPHSYITLLFFSSLQNKGTKKLFDSKSSNIRASICFEYIAIH